MVRRITVKSASEIAKKWADETPARASYYATEAPLAADEWEKNTIAAGGTYKSSLAVAGIMERFVGGVRKAGAGKFKRKVESVGVDRYAPGVAAAQEDMSKGIDPYIAVLEGLDIPDRGPRGSETNYGIVAVVGKALHKKRLAVLAATS